MPSKLSEILAALSEKERQRFLEFLRTPLFNDKIPPRDLAAFLCQHLNQPPPEAAAEHAAVWPGNPFNANQLRKLRHHTLELLLRFLALEHSPPEAHSAASLGGLNHLEEQPHFASLAQKALERHASPTIRDLYQRYQIHLEWAQQDLAHHSRLASPHLAEAHRLLETYTAAELARTAYLGLNQARITGSSFTPTSSLPHALEILEQPETPAEASGYRLLCVCLSNARSRESYRRLRQLLDQHSPRETWTHDLLHGALNYCYRQLNQGNDDFLPELQHWYGRMLTEGLLLVRGLLPPAQLKNAVTIGIRARAFAWATDLLECYGGEGTAADHCRGMLAYHQGDHLPAQKCFHRVLADPQDLFFGLDARVYLLRSYFETLDGRALESYGNAFRVFLQRHDELDAARRRRYRTFVRLLRKLYHIPAHDHPKRERLRKEVERMPHFPVRNWFLEQCGN